MVDAGFQADAFQNDAFQMAGTIVIPIITGSGFAGPRHIEDDDEEVLIALLA